MVLRVKQHVKCSWKEIWKVFLLHIHVWRSYCACKVQSYWYPRKHARGQGFLHFSSETSVYKRQINNFSSRSRGFRNSSFLWFLFEMMNWLPLTELQSVLYAILCYVLCSEYTHSLLLPKFVCFSISYWLSNNNSLNVTQCYVLFNRFKYPLPSI